MNKNIKNALLLSAVMSVSGAWASAPAAPYDDAQFDTTSGKLERKNSMAAFPGTGYVDQTDLDTKRAAYKAHAANRIAQHNSDITHLEGLAASNAAIPGLVDLNQWNGKVETKKIEVLKADGTREKMDKDGATVYNNTLTGAVAAQKAGYGARAARLKELVAEKTQFDTHADAVVLKSRKDALTDKYKASHPNLDPVLIDAMAAKEAGFTDEAADLYVSALDHLSKSGAPKADLDKAILERDAARTALQGTVAKAELDEAVQDFEDYRDALLPLINFLNGKLGTAYDSNSNPKTILKELETKWPTGGGNTGGGSSTQEEAPAPVFVM